MKHLLALLTVTLSLAACASQTQERSLKERKSDILLNAGIDSLASGDFSSALSSLHQAAKLTPKSPVVWTNIGTAYAGKDEMARAEESWRKALALDAQYNDARLNLGVLHFRQKRMAEAEKNLLDAEKDLAYSKRHQVAYTLALVYLDQGKKIQAEQQLRLALREQESFCPAWHKLGILQKERGDYQEAAKSLKGAVTGVCYKNPEVHYEIASLYLKARDLAHAKTKLLEIIQLFPESDWAKKAEVSLNMIR